LAELCYDTPSVEVVLFPVDTPDKTPDALSEDFYQEKLPSKPLVERLIQNLCSQSALLQENSRVTPLYGCHRKHKVGMKLA